MKGPLSALLVAAGESRRLGGMKPLLPFGQLRTCPEIHPQGSLGGVNPPLTGVWGCPPDTFSAPSPSGRERGTEGVRDFGIASRTSPFGGATLLEYQLDCLTALPEVGEVLVVLGHEPERLLPLLEGRRGVRAVVHQGYRGGPASSLKAGLRQLSPGVQAILIMAVDQPRPRWVLERLVAEHLQGQAPITAPIYRGRRGHPTLFSAALLPELLAVSEAQHGLREVLSRHRAGVREVELDTPAVLLDINTEADYQQALEMLSP